MDKIFENGVSVIPSSPNTEHVEDISMHVYRDIIDHTLRFTAVISYFEKENKIRKHRLEGNNFEELLSRVYNFCSKI